MVSKDCGEVLSIHRRAIHEIASADYSNDILEAWGPKVSPELVNQHIKNFDKKMKQGVLTLVAEHKGVLAGFGAIVPNENLLLSLYINPDFQRKGIGQLLNRALEKRACSEGLIPIRLFITPI